LKRMEILMIKWNAPKFEVTNDQKIYIKIIVKRKI